MSAKPFLLAGAIAALIFHGAIAGDCAHLNEASTKQRMTPSKLTEVMTVYGASWTTVTITVNGKSYTRTNTQPVWSIAPFDPKQQDAPYRTLAAQSHGVCERTGSESFNGEMADVYRVTNGRASATEWISQASGLPLKMRARLLQQDGATSIWSWRFEYGHVRPPQIASRRK